MDAALRDEIGGPTAWDGYATAACCEAGVEAQKNGEKVAVKLHAKPDALPLGNTGRVPAARLL